MNKKLLLSFSIFLGLSLLYFSVDTETESERLNRQYLEFVKAHPFNKTIHLSKKERKKLALPPNAYFEQEYLNEINPYTGRVHDENIFEVQRKIASDRIKQRVPGDAANNPWVERGPNNVGGRTRAVLWDPNDPNHKRVFAGGVSGGLWVNNNITDNNSSWQQVGISENLAITCITVDPNNSQIMYLGTGESYTSDNGMGNGVWKSVDGGSSWLNVYNDITGSIDNRVFFINDILAWNNPSTNKTEVFIGVGGAYYSASEQFVGTTKTGLYKTVNDGESWSKIILNTPGNSPYEPNDFEVGSDNTIWIGTENNNFGEGGGTIIKSTNGADFTVAYTIPTANTNRTEIAVSSQDPNKVFVLAWVRTSSDEGSVAPFLSFFRTEDAFTSVTNMTLPNDVDTDISPEDFTRGQAFYDLVIETDPTDDSILYVGGIDLFRSTDSGTSWKQMSKWSNNNELASLNVPLVHADQHGFAFHPTDANKALIGNDGGVYYASSLSNAVEDINPNTNISGRNKDYNTLQFYNGAIGQNTSSDILVAGAQDNGTQFINGAASNSSNASVDVYGGDGAYTFVDKDGEYMIASFVYNVKGLIKLPFSGSAEDEKELDDDQETGSFINPQDLDDNLDILYANAFDSGENKFQVRRYKGIKIGETLEKDDLSDVSLNEEVTALKVSPFETNSTTLFLGLKNGELLKVTNADSDEPSWESVKSVAFSGSISSISFGKNEDEIIVTFHNYGVVSIWYTDNGGLLWANKEGDFPDIPVKTSLLNPLNENQAIIGTELGVWTTYNFKDFAPNWVQANNGMSNVKVTSLELRTGDNTVLASTYGRGMFTGKFTTATSSVNDVLSGSKAFIVYPTISNGNFTIFGNNELGTAKLSIFDISGKNVYKSNIDFKLEKKHNIAVNLKTGVYFVNIVDDKHKKSSRKLIIQ